MISENRLFFGRFENFREGSWKLGEDRVFYITYFVLILRLVISY